MKRQWQILDGHGCEYSIDTQSDSSCGLIGLYNFCKDNNKEETFVSDPVEELSELEETENIETMLEVRGTGNK